MRMPFRELVLGGGGSKGVLHVGALLELSKHQPLVFPKGVYGSSIGSIVATYVAFGLPMENAPNLIQKHLSFQAIMPALDIASVASAFSTKGVGTMDLFEKQILAMFDEAGLDIREKVIADANMPLYIVASNLTDGVPSVFSNKIPILGALKASCCIPGAFRPYEMYGKAYIDGDILLPSITNILKTVDDDTLIFILPGRRRHILTPRRIESMSPVDYIREIHTLKVRVDQTVARTPQTLFLRYPELDSTSELSQFNVPDILLSAGLQFDRFFRSEHLD